MKDEGIGPFFGITYLGNKNRFRIKSIEPEINPLLILSIDVDNELVTHFSNTTTIQSQYRDLEMIIYDPIRHPMNTLSKEDFEKYRFFIRDEIKAGL